jgi:hypothetical protein
VPLSAAQELALRRLLDQIGIILDSYNLDLAEDWRASSKSNCSEGMDSEQLYQIFMDGFEIDLGLNMQGPSHQ